MSLQGFSYTTCDFATHKNGKEIRSITNLQKKTYIVSVMTIFVSNGDTKKSRIGLLHRNQFAEGIQLTWTIISQIYRKKKDLPKKALTIQISIAYLCDTNNNERLKLPIPQTQHNSTLDAPKLLNDTKHSHSLSQSCLLKGKKHKMLQSNEPIKQRSSRRKSAPLTSVTKTIALLPRFELAQTLEHEWTKNTFTKKSQHQNATFLCI